MADQDVHAATTLTEMMRRRAALTPDKPYFYLNGETITYGRLWAASASYAAGLARANLHAGDKLCLIYPTCAEFFYAFFGALRMGAVPVPLYPTLSVEATARIFNDAEAVGVARIGWFRKVVDESAARAPGVRTVLEPPDLEADAPEPADAEPGEEDLAFLQYTSGSTGHPRGVMLTHRNVVATIKFMAEAAGLTAEDRVVSWLPLYHDMGLIGCAFTPPLTGTPLWLLPPDLRNPRQWLELCPEGRATLTVSDRSVMLTHGTVVATIKSMAEAAGLTAEDRVVSWLPLYHDMGLIGCAFTPPLTGTPLWLLPPDLRNPRQWLELCTEVRATFTVSPDFGYRNCLRHVRDTTRLDLTSLQTALSRAETVRPGPHPGLLTRLRPPRRPIPPLRLP